MTQFTRWVAVTGMTILLASPLAFGRGFGGGMRGGGMGGARGGMGGGGMGGARGGMGGGGMGGPRGGAGGAGMRGGGGMAPRGGMAGSGRAPGAANRGVGNEGRAGEGGVGGAGNAGRGGYGGEGAGGFPGANGRGGFDQGAGYPGAANEGGLGRASGFSNPNAMHQTPMWSNGDMANRAAGMRNNFNNHDCFGEGWYGAHPGAWYGAGLARGTAWDAASWGMLAPMWGIGAAPMYYDYGNTVAVQGDGVYVNGDNVGTPAQYSQQATALAQVGQQAAPPDNDQWTPLGVFALESDNDQATDKLFQLAVDQSGVIRGNYYDAATDTTTPVAGSVDSKTQRAAWTIGDKQDRVFDTGIYNLTKEQAAILVHTGDDQTQQMLLVRMRQKSKPANSLQNP